MISFGFGFGFSPPGALLNQFCDEYQAIYDAFTNKPTAEIADCQNAMVKQLIAAGIWAKFDRFFYFGLHDASESLMDLIHPSGTKAELAHGTGGSNPVFTQHQGYTFTAANKSYIDSKYNPSLHADKFKLNSNILGFYFRKLNFANGQLQCSVNATNGQNLLGCSPRYNAVDVHSNARFYSSNNITAGSYTTGTNQDFTGIYASMRTSDTNVYECRNNQLTAIVSNSVSIPSGIIDFGRATNGFYTDGQMQFAFVGESLTQTEFNALVTITGNYRYKVDGTIIIIGDSTVANNGADMPRVSSLIDGDTYAFTDLSYGGEKIAQQKTRFIWHTDEYLSTIKVVFVQIGLNDVNTYTSSVCIAAYQDLIDTIRAKIGDDNKIVGVTMVPGVRVSYQAYIDLNEAIRGNGATPITGLDAILDTHLTALNAGDGTLAAAYSVDGTHENTAGRQIIADLYDAQLDVFGI